MHEGYAYSMRIIVDGVRGRSRRMAVYGVRGGVIKGEL